MGMPTLFRRTAASLSLSSVVVETGAISPKFFYSKKKEANEKAKRVLFFWGVL